MIESSNDASAAAKRKFFQRSIKYSYDYTSSRNKSTKKPRSTITIYGCEFSPKVGGKSYIVACTSNGLICVWDSNGAAATSEPCLQVEAVLASSSYNALYDVKFIESSGEILLIVAGDPGILVYKWSAFLDAIDDQSNENNSEGNVVVVEPITKFKPHPSPESEPVEINATSYNAIDGILYAAAGDAFGCYQWDLRSEKLVGTFGGAGQRKNNGHADYLHDVLSIPDKNNLIITGGEDGNIAFWDGKERKLIEMINVQSTMNKHKRLVTWQVQNKGFGSSTQQWSNGSNLWVSSLERKGDWLAAVGGSESGNNMGRSSTAGFMATFHLPTRTFTSGCATRESYNAVTYNESLDHFVSGGNDGRVTFWDSTSGACTGRSWCTNSITYAMACDSSGMMLVGGAGGGSLDCFIDRVKGSTLHLK